MKRLYRISVVIEREFSRKATAEVQAVKDRIVPPFGWTLVRSRVSSSAKRERAPPKIVEPEPSIALDSWMKNSILIRVSGDKNGCILALGTGECYIHRGDSTETVLAGIERAKGGRLTPERRTSRSRASRPRSRAPSGS